MVQPRDSTAPLFVLYVADQAAAADFYRHVLTTQPTVDVVDASMFETWEPLLPRATDFDLSASMARLRGARRTVVASGRGRAGPASNIGEIPAGKLRQSEACLWII